MFYLITLGVFVGSPVLQFVSAEAWAIFVGLHAHRPFWAVALVLAASQTVGFALLYLFGHKTLMRIKALHRAVARLDHDKLRSRSPILLGIGALVGLPPFNALCVTAPLVEITLRQVILYSLVGRTVRFSVLFLGAGWFVEVLHINLDWLPPWLVALA